MRVMCSGLATTNGTNIITGTNSLYTTELRPGDVISVNSTSAIVYSIFSNNSILVDCTIPTIIDKELYITRANAEYLLPITNLAYSDGELSLGGGLYSDNPILHGGQAFNYLTDLSMSTLTSTKALALPVGYEYSTPFINMVIVQTETNSSILTVIEPGIKLSTTLNSNVAVYISGSKALLLPGLCINIDGSLYVINEFDPSGTSIYLDKVATSSLSSVAIGIPEGLIDLFPIGSYVLLNGRLNTIINVTGSSIIINYAVSDTAVVTLRQPLMATQYAQNTTELFNCDYSTAQLNDGDIIIVQNIHSEDNLYAINSCYTEVKHVNRIFNSVKLITDELNIIPMIGIVCIGKFKLGLQKFLPTMNCSSTSIYTKDSSIFDKITIGDVAFINGLVYTVTGKSSGQNYVIVDRAPTAGYNEVYFSIKQTVWKDYTEQVNSLILCLVSKIILSGMRCRQSISDLIKTFISTYSYSIFCTTSPIVIHSVYEPEYFAVNCYAAPRTPYTLVNSICLNTSCRNYYTISAVVKYGGLRLLSING